MSANVCDRFQQHTWRKDTCANCLKPKKQHSPDANPQPAKRLSNISTSGDARAVLSRSEIPMGDVGQAESQTESSQRVEAKQASGPDAKRLSVVGSPRPAPIKAKPVIVSKPEKAKKPGMVTDSGEKTSTARKIAGEPASQDVICTSDITCEVGKAASLKQGLQALTRENQSEACDADLNTVQKINKVKSRPQITPPQVPDPSKIPNTALSTKSSLTKTELKTSVKPKSSAVDALNSSAKHSSSSDSSEKPSGSHYYQIYDIAAKGLSGMPEPIDPPDQNGVIEAAKRTDVKGAWAGGCRIVDVGEELQNVAMPYTVVDVTVCQPNRDQLLSKAPPQLPATPAPIRDGHSVSGGLNNTLPPDRPTRNGNELLKHATLNSSPKAMRKSLMHDLSKSGNGNSLTNLCPSETLSARGTAVLPLDGKFLAGKIAHQDLYEDIGGSNDTDKHSSLSSLNSEINSMSSGNFVKSATLEAKMAALSKLDLSKAIAPAATSSSHIRTDDFKLDTLASAASADKQEPVDTNDPKASEVATVIALNRQEKGRKSGGKSFFQKFLKRGTKEATAEAQSRSSSLNVSIETILNIPSTASRQNTPEPTNKSSATGSSDCLVNSSSPSKTSTNKPSLLPVTSPAKKQPQTSDQSEAGESSGNSNISSSEKNGKIAEKVTAEESNKDILASKEEPISADLPKITPVKPSVAPRPAGIVLDDEAPTEVFLNPTKDCLTAARDKLKPCTSLSRLPDGTKPVEDKMAFAEILRDALTLKTSDKDATVRDAVDASPTDGTDHALNSLNSGKGKVQKDIKLSKAPRKMMAPPPMAPPPPPISTKDPDGSASSSSPKHNVNMTAEIEHPLQGLSSSFRSSSPPGRQTKPGELMPNTSSIFPMSNTLPRKSSSSTNPTELKVAAGTVGLRQLDSAAKHARNKTVSEGVRFEKLLIAPEEGEGKNLSEDGSVPSETLARRVSKFLNRALPAPPPNETPPDPGNCLDEIDNLYELVSQSEPTGEKSAVDEEQLTYEDIDIYCAKTNNESGSKASSASSSQRSTSVQATNQKQGTSSSDSSVSPGSNYYLEPVGGKEEPEVRGRGFKDDWRPCPAPRGSHLSKAVAGQEQTAMSYVNTRMINGQLPLNTSDGFDAMAGLIVNMLYHLTDRLYANYITRFLKNRSDIFWTDFELLNFTPRIVQETASFYEAKHLVLAPSGCILMVAKESQGSSLSLEPVHANVISPLVCFTMTASDLETLSGSMMKGETSVLLRSATVAVLLCSDVATLDDFWEREHNKALSESTTTAFEQSVCHCLVQVINSLLYLRDSGCTVLRLSSDDVIMARLSDSRWHPLVKPSLMTFDVCSDLDSSFLGDDVALLLFQMLRIESGKTERPETKVVPPQTVYSRGLQRVLRLLVPPRTWEGLETGRNLLEFILWGPSEEEAKFVAITDKRETSFRVWLEVARCRMTSELVLQLERHNLELANQAKFLCRVTENSLLDVTKLLFE